MFQRESKFIKFLNRYEYVLIILFFTILTFIMTWPLLLKMKDYMVGRIGDNIYFVWMIGWLQKAFFELHTNPFDVWFLNYPEGWSLAYTEITPINLLLALPFSLIAGPTFGFNAAMMISFILSGIGMYLWIKHLTKRSGPALIAGMIYAFIPYHFAHFRIGHLNLSGIQWFPFYFWGLFNILETRKELIDEKRKTWKWLVIAGLALGLIALTSQYYLYMSFFITAFVLLWYLVVQEREQIKDIRLWKQLFFMILIAAPLIIMAVLPYISLLGKGGLPDRNLGIVRLYSASPTDFLLPSTEHFLWGQWIGDHFNRDNWVEGTLYVGGVDLILTIIVLLNKRESQYKRLISLLIGGAIFAMILAMGTDLHWLSESVEIPTPAFLKNLINRPQIPILLPGYFLFLYFPLYAKLRALMRFGIFTLVFTSALAGLGVNFLMDHFNKKKPSIKQSQKDEGINEVLTSSRNKTNSKNGSRVCAFIIGLIFLVFIDFYPGIYHDFVKVEARPVDYWLAEQQGDGALIQFPFSKAEDQEHTYYTLIHGKPYVGGFFNAFPPRQYREIYPIMENFPDDDSINLLYDFDVQYVLIDVDDYDNIDMVKNKCESYGLEFTTQIDDQMIFIIKK